MCKVGRRRCPTVAEHSAELGPDVAALGTGRSGSTFVRVTVLSPHGQHGHLPVQIPHLNCSNISNDVEITGGTSDSQNLTGCATGEPKILY